MGSSPDHPFNQDRENAANSSWPQEQSSPEGSSAERPPPGQPGGDPGQSPGYRGYPGYPGDPGYQGMAPAGRINGISVASLVCGLAQFLLWFFLLVPGFIAALLGLVLGVVALGQIRRRGETGRGMALTGILLGGLGVVAGVALAILIGVGSAHYRNMGY